MVWAMLAWLTPFVLVYIFLSWIRRWVTVDNITKRFILITGCDHGYGNLLAQRLDMLGCQVLAACVSENAKNRLQQTTSSRLKAFTLDVTSDDHIKQAVDFVKVYVPENEGLWAVVNNDEIDGEILGPIEWHTPGDISDVLEINTVGTMRVTLAFLPLLKKAGGRVVMMSHMYARLPHPLYIPYSASKAAVEAFADGLRPHLSSYGVSVHIIEPGNFQADIGAKQRMRKGVQQAWKALPCSIREEYGETYMEQLTAHMTTAVDMASPKVNKVIKACLHAVTARCPLTRYTVGTDACFTWIPLSYLPSVFVDLLLCRWTQHLLPACLKLADTPRGEDLGRDTDTPIQQ